MLDNNILSLPTDIHFEILSYFSPTELSIVSNICNNSRMFVNRKEYLNSISNQHGLPYKRNINKVSKYYKKTHKELFQHGIEKDNLRMVDYHLRNVSINNSHFETAIYHNRLNILQYFVNGFAYDKKRYEHNIKINIDKHILEMSSENLNQDITKFLYTSYPHFINKNIINNLSYSDQIDLIQFLLKQDSVKNNDQIWDEALYYACKGGKIDTIKLLLKNKILIDRTCFIIATIGGYINTIDILVKHIQKYPQTYLNYYMIPVEHDDKAIIVPQEALYYACKKGLIFMVQYLLENHLEFNNTAFIYAIEGGYLDMIKFLIQTCNIIYNTEALIKAIELNSEEVVKHLLELSFPVNKKCDEYANLVGNSKIINLINKYF